LASRTLPSGWGDVSVGLGLLVLSGNLRLSTLPAVLVGVVCSAITFIACGIVMHSLAFWLGRTHTLSRALWEFTLLFSLYPPVLFGGGIRFLLFILLPAAIVAYLPVDLVRHPGAVSLLATLAATASYAAFALWIFERGLRRYASGNRITTRA
jgi:ABC-2 type transport system permease protein